MFYRDYKNKCPQCETKPNSYDPKKKTIIVYVPKATDIALPDYGIEGLNELRAIRDIRLSSSGFCNDNCLACLR